MKIVVVCEVLGEPNNGTSVASYNLINSLREKGHEVTVVCPDQYRKGEEGYCVLPLTNAGPIMKKIFEINKVVLPRYDEKTLKEAFEGADCVHIMMSLFISRKTTKLVKAMNIPLTAGFHNQAENFSVQFGFLNSRIFNHLVYRWYDKNVFCRADAIHYPTQFIRDIFEKEVGRKTNGYVISNGVNELFVPQKVQKPKELQDKFCILFIGRLSNEKSHAVLIKAVKKSKYQDKIQLLFAGEGPKLKKLQRLGGKLKNPPMIQFYSRKELCKIINYADLYCHPAVAEIEAIACLEAISCGLVPVIANSDRCATKAFALDERSLFKTNDSRDLASKIDYFIEHPQEKEELSKKYLQTCVKYNQKQCMDQMEQMIVKTVADVKGRA